MIHAHDRHRPSIREISMLFLRGVIQDINRLGTKESKRNLANSATFPHHPLKQRDADGGQVLGNTLSTKRRISKCY